MTTTSLIFRSTQQPTPARDHAVVGFRSAQTPCLGPKPGLAAECRQVQAACEGRGAAAAHGPERGSGAAAAEPGARTTALAAAPRDGARGGRGAAAAEPAPRRRDRYGGAAAAARAAAWRCQRQQRERSDGAAACKRAGGRCAARVGAACARAAGALGDRCTRLALNHFCATHLSCVSVRLLVAAACAGL